MPVSFISVATAAWALACLATMALASFVAASHPLWPQAAFALLLAWVLAVHRAPRLWLVVVPAALPLLNFSPWTGWVAVEEFDILVLGTAAAGFARLAVHPAERPAAMLPRAVLGAATLLLLTLAALARGVADAGGWTFGWYQGYTEPLNSVRVAKSSLHALLLWPLLRCAWQSDSASTLRRFAIGVVAGTTIVVAAIVWERVAYPGLLDISSPYRTTALFWEMHVGGAAIDAYVAACSPFVAWSLWAARRRRHWLLAAALAAFWTYAVLTTYSRGAYLGIGVGLLVLGLTLPSTRTTRWWLAARALAGVLGAALVLALVIEAWGYLVAVLALALLAALLWHEWRRSAVRHRRVLASGLLVLFLVFEVVVVFGPDSFMARRTVAGAADYKSRKAHWMQGITLLDGASDWVWGLGLGRLPAHYARSAPDGEFPGAVRWQSGGGHDGFVRVDGPRTRAKLGALFGLTQRVPLVPRYALRFDVRSDRAVRILVRVCESHLLYVGACQWAIAGLASGTGGQWKSIGMALRGPPLRSGAWYAPKQFVLTLSVINTGGSADFDNLVLLGIEPRTLLANGEFSQGLAHWLPAAQMHFLPWHIDNAYLELLIERGILGALVVLGLIVTALRRLLRAVEAGSTTAPFVAAALVGLLTVGLVSSFFDVARVSLLAALLLSLGLCEGARVSPDRVGP